MIYSLKNYREANFIWHFCYLDGEAEELNHGYNSSAGYEDAPDLVGADVEMPGLGEYDGILHGQPCKIFIAEKWKGCGWNAGRIALVADPERVEFNRNSENWR